MDASWIWSSREAHPRNVWVVFRKTFNLSEIAEGATLSVAADSRYAAYVNGERIGMGPVRGWPEEPFYDTYDVAHLLAVGPNVLAVLVHHLGSSSFQYIESDASLAAELLIHLPSGPRRIATDESWRAHEHRGYLRDTVRNYPQQGFTEVYDARAMEDRWRQADLDDQRWTTSVRLDAASPAWLRKPRPRDIPPLREDVVSPERIICSRVVQRHGTAVTLDLKPVLEPTAGDMNKRDLLAYLATVVHCPEETECELQFPWWRMLSLYGSVRIGEQAYELAPDARSLRVLLPKGESLLLMDISGVTHSYSSYFRFATELPLSFRAPFSPGHRFAVIGPFASRTILTIGERADESFQTEREDYRSVWKARKESELEDSRPLLRPVPVECDSPHNVYDDSVYRRVVREQTPGPDEEAMLIPNGLPSLFVPPEDGDRELTVDFGRELSGYVEIRLQAPAGVTVDCYGVECIRADGTVEHTEGVHCTMRYITREGRQSYRSEIRRGFRYLRITFRWPSGSVRPVRVERLLTHLATAAVARTGAFSCAQMELDRIWEISRDTTQLCMEDTFVDCPCYEQTFWVGDARGEALIAYYAFGAYSFARRCLLLVAPSLRRSPVTESQVPSGWQNVLTAWSLFWMSACREYHEHSGDEPFLTAIYPSLQRCAEGFLDRVNDEGLLEISAWNMLDWAPMDTPENGLITHQNASLVKALRDTAWIARRLGRANDAVDYEREADRIRSAINVSLWSEERAAFRDCVHEDGTPSRVFSVQTNIMAYLCECAEGSRARALERVILDPPAGFVRIGSPFVTFFYYAVLARLRETTLLLGDIRKNYGMMLREGATSCWETFPGWERGRLTRSHCQGWSAAPVYFLGAHVLGVRPLEPGFSRALVDPSLGDLAWARGAVPTPHGPIVLTCERRGSEEGTPLLARVRAPREVQLVPAAGVELL